MAKKKSLLSKIGDKAKSVTSKVASTAKKAASAVVSTAKKVGGAVKDTIATGFKGTSPSSVLASVIQATGRASQDFPEVGVKKGDSVYAPASANNPIPKSGNTVNQPSQPQYTALSPGQFGGPIAPPAKPKKTGSISLPASEAPSNAEDISPEVGTFDFSGGSSSRSSNFSALSGGSSDGIMGSGTANAGAAVAGLETSANQAIKSQKELEAEQAMLSRDKAQKDSESFLKKIFKEEENQADDLEDRRQDLEKQYQIQAKTAEINSLQQSLNNVEVQVANQVAQAKDVLGSNNFINNQIQQIERNSAPALNQLRSDINFKTAVLTQNEALLEKAMEQATAESKRRVDNMKWFYEQHYDKVISKLDKRYDDALRSKIKEEEDEHEYQQKLWEWKRDTIIEYGLDGLTPSDSEGVISRAASKRQAKVSSGSGTAVSGGSLEEQIANLKLSAGQKGDLVDIYTLDSQINDLENFAADGILEGIGGLGVGSAKQAAFKIFGSGSEEGASVRTTIGNIKGQIAKLRGGTSFTANEEKLLDSYVPGINESTPSVLAKLKGLKKFLASKKEAIVQVGGGNVNTSNDPLGIR